MSRAQRLKRAFGIYSEPGNECTISLGSFGGKLTARHQGVAVIEKILVHLAAKADTGVVLTPGRVLPQSVLFGVFYRMIKSWPGFTAFYRRIRLTAL